MELAPRQQQQGVIAFPHMRGETRHQQVQGTMAPVGHRDFMALKKMILDSSFPLANRESVFPVASLRAPLLLQTAQIQIIPLHLDKHVKGKDSQSRIFLINVSGES